MSHPNECGLVHWCILYADHDGVCVGGPVTESRIQSKGVRDVPPEPALCGKPAGAGSKCNLSSGHGGDLHEWHSSRAAPAIPQPAPLATDHDALDAIRDAAREVLDRLAEIGVWIDHPTSREGASRRIAQAVAAALDDLERNK